MTSMCPNCGYNLKADEVIERDGFLLDPRGAVAFGGAWLDVPKAQACMLHSIANAGERSIPKEALFNRHCNEDAVTDAVRLIDKHICLARKALREQGAPDPIETIWRTQMLRWSVRHAETKAA